MAVGVREAERQEVPRDLPNRAIRLQIEGLLTRLALILAIVALDSADVAGERAGAWVGGAPVRDTEVRATGVAAHRP